jgi:serine/threonine-protein kinase
MREMIGRYRIVCKMGEGGMGVLYAARDENLDRLIAIKMIRKGAGSEGRDRLRQEARLAASVNHPNVCQVYHVGEDGGELYLVMELLEGIALSARIASGAVSLPESFTIMREILAALSALHAHGIIHRDLKPSNVFLTQHGVKLLDFGLASPKPVNLRVTDPDFVPATTIAGTPRYLAPEAWNGEPATPASDLFAAGAILFEIVTGAAAFTGSSVTEIARTILDEPRPFLCGNEVIDALNRVVQRALAPRAADRYTKAAEMARDLASVESLSAASNEPLKITIRRP